ncbi:alginate export family protein [Flavihumibacter fluvii]|uniref:alginate export family protein n=1 Tax=Flavihumibacter fluvii TaxID=2838157 RepID=UPI001BDF6734|nr:alginate export family protein [Flavihumibacter fluvii]ULQ51771.1 alginate export family protein [Flavihumibacter fluvii]
MPLKINKLIILFLFSLNTQSIFAQVSSAFYDGERITNVFYVFQNKLVDSLAQKNIEQAVKRAFPIFPQTIVRTLLLDAYTNKVRKLEQVAKAQYEVLPSQMGGINITLTIVISDSVKEQRVKSGVLTGEKDFPILYQDNKSLLTTKFALAQMLYTNNNAWYGREDAMLDGNPLAHNPAGKGFTGWIEGWISAGLYGITTLSTKNNTYLYGGASYIVSGSVGRELFTDQSRVYGAFDDAFVGFMGTVGYPSGNRFTYNLSMGRQQFTVGKGFLIRNTASNGDNRGALQLNPRWAADYLGLASVRYNNLLLQVFQLDPDELDLVDSKTLIRGFNAEWGDGYSNQIGFMLLGVPQSSYNYYTPSGDVLGRKGLMLFNLRYYTNKPPNVPGLFYRGEIAYERNTNFKMASLAGYSEIGWSFAKSPGTPSLRYRYAYFSGDDPDTEVYERWDPLLSGGNGEEWVIGANHFKVVQNSNINVHQLQGNIRPWPKIELVPQAIFMYAEDNNNIGGNPALGNLPQKEYGSEFNITVKYFRSSRWYWHGHVAYTIPGVGVREALGNSAKPWLSAMLFFRYAL